MKHMLSLCFAILLGLVAAGLNWVWISGLARPTEFVSTRIDLKAGHTVAEDDLVAVPVPGDVATLKKSLIPFANRAILFGTNTTRDYAAGDVVFHRDVHEPAESSEWDVIGPFKLISVGERFKQSGDDELEYSRTDGNNLTIAVDANFDGRTKRLLEVISSEQNGDQVDRPHILAVQVLPGGKGSDKSPPLSEVVYQTVSLDGIANVPRVLLEGDMIRFVVPARPRY